VVYVIIVTSIVNLSLQNGKNELWITLLSIAIGYALPKPTLKVAKP
jgi:FtsH-binding integral membrane protein